MAFETRFVALCGEIPTRCESRQATASHTVVVRNQLCLRPLLFVLGLVIST